MLTLTKLPSGDLRLALTADDEERDDIRQTVDQHGIRWALIDLLEGHLSNGWEIIEPEEVGALTDALILTDEAERDDYGDLTALGRVYWNPNYQIQDDVEELLTTGAAEWEGVS